MLDSPLEQITLSFDGFKKETFEFYRKGAKFEKVRDNFVRFARMKHERRSRLQVVVQMVKMDGNAAEVDDFWPSGAPFRAWTSFASRPTRPTSCAPMPATPPPIGSIPAITCGAAPCT